LIFGETPIETDFYWDHFQELDELASLSFSRAVSSVIFFPMFILLLINIKARINKELKWLILTKFKESRHVKEYDSYWDSI
jgi:hypothetical protein